MKRTLIMMVIIAGLLLAVEGAETASYVLDNRPQPLLLTADAEETIVFDPAWAGSSTCTVLDESGSLVSDATTAGVCKWKPQSKRGTLTYKAGDMTMTVKYVVVEQDFTMTISVMAGKYVPVSLPFGTGTIEWQDVIKTDNLVDGTTAMIPREDGGRSCYKLVTEEATLKWCLQAGEAEAPKIKTGDTIWIMIPKKEGAAESVELKLVNKLPS